MSRYLPQSSYAEDQPYAYTILTAHTLMRGEQTGAGIGAIWSFASATLQRRKAARPVLPIALGSPVTQTSTLSKVLTGTGKGSIYGLGFLTVGLVGRMWGREEIEWKDRSWRLLSNEGQVECDDWAMGGMGLGFVLAGAREAMAQGLGNGKAMRIWGGANLGNVIGVLGYMGYRYGMHGGKALSER